MNAFSDMAASADAQQVADAVLAPLSPEAPCGPPMRHDPVFTDIRLLREEDDPSLPMRQWERPLKRADWPLIERRCIDMLSTQSKDLQILVWLVESWLRQRGLPGLCDGLRLFNTMLRQYWPLLHPMIEKDGDGDARLAPLEWLNESLSISVRVHAPLLRIGASKAQCVTLADWERVAGSGDAAGAQAQDGPDGPLTRADMVAAAAQEEAEMAMGRAAARDSLDYLQSAMAFLAERLGPEAPNLAKLQNALETVQRVLLQLLPEQAAGVTATDAAAPEAGADECDEAAPSAVQGNAAAAAGAPFMHAGWRDRGEAYATLEALADYLFKVEPHSPAPFLIRRAVRWGHMPLPEVLAEIIREEGDLNRLINVLGIKL